MQIILTKGKRFEIFMFQILIIVIWEALINIEINNPDTKYKTQDNHIITLFEKFEIFFIKQDEI